MVLNALNICSQMLDSGRVDPAFITEIEAFNESGPSTPAGMVSKLSKLKDWQRRSKAAEIKPVTGIGYARDSFPENF